jgi:hypothetical protein
LQQSVAKSEERVLELLLCLGLCAAGLAVVAGIGFAIYGEPYWLAVSTALILTVCSAAVATGRELERRGQLALLARSLVVAAPVAGVLLLVGVWRDEASRLFVQSLLTATTLMLAGLAVGSLRLHVRNDRGTAAAVDRAVTVLAVAVAVLALVLIWWDDAPGVLTDALLGGIGGTVILYGAGVLFATLERRSRQDLSGGRG